MSDGHDWYFDFISPCAYSQWVRVRRDYPRLKLRPRPVLLAGLLNHWGQLGPAELPGKRKHTYRHVYWQSRQQQIPLRFPPAHPFNPLPALRLSLAAPDRELAVDLLFRHIWEHGRAGDSVEALSDIAAELGVADLTAALAREDVKRELAENGKALIALGGFGVPTLEIDGHLFWGNDATVMALHYLDQPTLFDDAEVQRLDALPAAARRPAAPPLAETAADTTKQSKP